MKTDDQRLQLVLDFVNMDGIAPSNLRELRANLAEFLGYPLLADGEIFPDLNDGTWPSNIGGTGFEVSTHIDLTGISMSKGYEARDALAGFIGFGPEQEVAPVGVLRRLQNSTRGLIDDYLEDEDADRRRHATWVERGPGTEERRAVGERKLPKDTISHLNKLAESLGGTITAVGRGSTLRAHVTAEPLLAFQWIVLLLINGVPDIRICARPKCLNFFVSNRSSNKYCTRRCSNAERNARQYADPKKRKAKIKYMRAKRASERR